MIAHDLGQFGGGLGQGHKARARLLRQAFEQGLNFVFEHAGHQPLGAFFADLVQHKQRHTDRDAVARVTRCMQILGAAIHTPQTQGIGKGLGRHAGGAVAHQVFAPHAQELWLVDAGFLVPLLQAAPAVHMGRQLGFVKSLDDGVVHQHILAARFVLQGFDLGQQALVGVQKRPIAIELGIDQCFTDEDLPRPGFIHTRIGLAATAVHHQSIQGGALHGQHIPTAFVPMRVQHLAPQQMLGHLLQPCGVELRHTATKQARCLDKLGTHHPAARFFLQPVARVGIKANAPGPQVGLIVIGLEADVAEQARQQRQVQLLVAGRCAVARPALLGDHRDQLRMHIAPFAPAPHMDEALFEQVFQLALAQFVLAHPVRLDPIPQAQVADKFALVIVKTGMGLVGCRARLGRAFAHVLDAHGGRDDQHFTQGLALARFQHHAPHPRVQRQTRQGSAQLGELVLLIHRRQLRQQLVAIGNGLGPGCF